jgi:predicted molibdopterin-dependent oxidoreductase YjgC
MSITTHDRRLPPLGNRDPLTVRVDGASVQAFAGESVATVLLALGRFAFRHTTKDHAPRGVFCGMGVCFDCLVTIDGVPNVRACMRSVQAGMVIETGEQPNG